jgi:hypothetical protein
VISKKESHLVVPSSRRRRESTDSVAAEYSRTQSLTHPLNHLLKNSLTHSLLKHSLTHLLTYKLPLTHSSHLTTHPHQLTPFPPFSHTRDRARSVDFKGISETTYTHYLHLLITPSETYLRLTWLILAIKYSSYAHTIPYPHNVIPYD